MSLPFPVPIPTGKILDKVSTGWSRRKKSLKIEEIQLVRPKMRGVSEKTIRDEVLEDLTHSVSELGEDGHDLPLELWLEFRLKSRTPIPVEECPYAVVVEFSRSGPETGTRTINFTGEFDSFDGLSEPHLSPVRLTTDLEEEIRFSEEGASPLEARNLDLENEIQVTIKVTSPELTAEEVDISIHRLLSDWVGRYEGMDLRNLANPSEFDGLTELPAIEIGEDIGDGVRRLR